jgi:hypothetical protein
MFMKSLLMDLLPLQGNMCVHDLARAGAIQELKDAVAAGKADLAAVDSQGNSVLMTALLAQQWDAATGKYTRIP